MNVYIEKIKRHKPDILIHFCLKITIGNKNFFLSNICSLYKNDTNANTKKNKRSESVVEIVMPKAESSKGRVEQEIVQVDGGSQPLVEVMDPSNSYASETPAEVVNKDIMITVRSKKNSWLRVKTDGETVFQTTLKQGVVESWSADENIEISGKNLAQLEIEFNGKMIGNLARDGRLANTVVITKKGLSVIK